MFLRGAEAQCRYEQVRDEVSETGTGGGSQDMGESLKRDIIPSHLGITLDIQLLKRIGHPQRLMFFGSEHLIHSFWRFPELS